MKNILFFLLLSVSSLVVFAQKQVIDSASPGVRLQGSNMPSRISMTPATTRQTQGKTFGEKAATGKIYDPEPAGKGIQENGIKRVESAAREEKRTYTGGR
ncbi:MAG TPA: hypothetical protein PKE30_09455 [Niabella sp.]|nr:hypothetical protein [Niabella sp.]